VQLAHDSLLTSPPLILPPPPSLPPSSENAIDCSSFFDDLADVELWQIADFLVSIKNCPDARLMCRHWREWCKNNPSSVPAPQIGLKLY